MASGRPDGMLTGASSRRRTKGPSRVFLFGPVTLGSTEGQWPSLWSGVSRTMGEEMTI
jgi:hypothetical protein